MRLPRIKHTQTPVRHRDNATIRTGAGLYGVALELRDKPDGSVWKLMSLLDGTRDMEAVVRRMRRDDPDLDGRSVRESVQDLADLGLVEDAGAEVPGSLSAAETERYAANTAYFSWVDMTAHPSAYEQQRRLKRSRVAVLGLGATGTSVAASLAAVGVGSLVCADFGVVAPADLNRQLLYTEDDIGSAKADAAAARLRRINPHVEVSGIGIRVSSPGDLAPLMRADIFVLCAEGVQPQLAAWANEAALRAGTPWMISNYRGPLTLTGMFLPRQTPCYRCLLHQYPTMDPETEQVWQPLFDEPPGPAVIAPVSIVSGQFAALDAICHLIGMPTQTDGRLFRQSLLVYDQSCFFDLKFWPQCPACGAG
jgi:molybdopterin/thiamine biosynthesis adenylyltransferase